MPQPKLTLQANITWLQSRRDIANRNSGSEESQRESQRAVHEGVDPSLHCCDVSCISRRIAILSDHRRSYVEDPSLPSSSTMTDDPVVPGSTPPPTNALVAIVEMGMGGMASDDRVRIGLVSVVPGTGDVVWDEFDGESNSGCCLRDFAQLVQIRRSAQNWKPA